MTQERFLKLLENPDLLASISYEELKTLALTYPYVHNLRYLLAIKSDQDNHPEFARNLAAAAAHSLDRTRLFTLIAPKRIVPQAVQEEELVLELKPIETIQRELEARAPVARTDAPPVQAASASFDDLPGISDVSLPLDKTPEPDLILNDLTPAGYPLEEIPDVPVEPARPLPPVNPLAGPAPAPSFSVWVSQFNPPSLVQPVPGHVGQSAPKEDLTTTAKTSSEDASADLPALTPQMLAEKSVTENKSIVSETLAKLYIQQGHREKAIEMYERLCLAFPDKSAYFAGEIEKLKK